MTRTKVLIRLFTVNAAIASAVLFWIHWRISTRPDHADLWPTMLGIDLLLVALFSAIPLIRYARFGSVLDWEGALLVLAAFVAFMLAAATAGVYG